MPRYFFNVTDSDASFDPEGTELIDIYEAQSEAVKLSGELLQEIGGRFWNGQIWELEVSDASGRVLFTLRFSATEHNK